MTFRSEFLKTISERGFIHQITDETGLDELLTKPAVAAYCGFDCTAPSLHVGSLLQIMLLRRYQQAGHKPIILLGGGTTKIGDPSGKDEARKLLTDEDIAANMAGIRKVFEKFVTFGDGPTDAVLVNNDDWLRGLNYIDFLRDYGRHFSVNRMLTMDSVRLRLEREQNLSFLEFNYMILQAYDFVELKERFDCRLQFGGSDQWGNIINGVELFRKYRNNEFTTKVNKVLTGKSEEELFDTESEKLFGLTTPLITTASGAKMGKTAAGAVWLDESMVSPYDYWQFWRNTEDADVSRFLKIFTDLSLEDIVRLESGNINDAKKVLATEATALCHGREAALAAAETARKTFEEGLAGDSLPGFAVARAELEKGIPAYQLFHLCGLEESGGKARKLIQGKGAKINDETVTDENRSVTITDLGEQGFIKLSAGKKRHIKVIAKP